MEIGTMQLQEDSENARNCDSLKKYDLIGSSGFVFKSMKK